MKVLLPKLKVTRVGDYSQLISTFVDLIVESADLTSMLSVDAAMTNGFYVIYRRILASAHRQKICASQLPVPGRVSNEHMKELQKGKCDYNNGLYSLY